MVAEAINGNVKAFLAIRDTIGEKPADTLNFSADDNIKGIEISFVDKSKRSGGAERDPKIATEYTAPVGASED
jgi:hypothetical protein